jgi:hypothetical protein
MEGLAVTVWRTMLMRCPLAYSSCGEVMSSICISFLLSQSLLSFELLSTLLLLC